MPPLADDLATRAQTLGQTIISNLSRWYDRGVFWQVPTNVWYLSTLAPACLLATLAKYTTNPILRNTYINLCIEIVDRVVEQSVNDRGVFTAGAGGLAAEGPDPASQGGVFTDTAAIETVASIGWILLQIPDYMLPASTRARWVQACQTNCSYMDTVAKDTTFYINGNFNSHLLNAYWFTAEVSNDGDRSTYQDMYERGLAFLLDPGSSNPAWAGYGLIIDTPGVAIDWSDYVLHLAETNGYLGINPANTFDPYYSQLQLDLLSRLFVINRDYRISRLINGISNKMEPLINTTTWVTDCSNGSRHNSPGQGFQQGYYAVTSLLGCKALNTTLLDSTHILDMWDRAISVNLLGNSTTGFYGAPTFRQLAIALAVVRECAELAKIKIPAV